VAKVCCLALGVSTITSSVSCTESSSDPAVASTSVKGNQPPIITTAKILTDPILLDRPVEVQVDAQDPEREAVSFQYQWYVDNTPLSKQTSPSLPGELVRRGQVVSVEITPTDGLNKGQPYRTKSAVVGNTSPKIMGISLIPQTARAGDRLEAQVEASDPDHDRVDTSYTWYRNDAVIKDGEESFLDTAGFAARDRIVVEVTARDPSGAGHSLKSDIYVLGNSAPKIVSIPPQSASQEHFDYQVNAIDSDGDTMTYQLEMAPPGMTISAASGHIVWQIPSDQQGTFHVKVVAKDGQGGMATQEFDVTLTAVSPTSHSGV
jgi:Putative Ig domain